jgi:hypothetical protein
MKRSARSLSTILALLLACVVSENPDEGDASSSGASSPDEAGESTTSPGSPELEAQAACAAQSAAEACELTTAGEGYRCAWLELAAYTADACAAADVTSECLAITDVPPTPGCVPEAGCMEPAPLHGTTYLRPAWRTEGQSTVLFDACGGFVPVGFAECTFASGDDPVCACACSGAG